MTANFKSDGQSNTKEKMAGQKDNDDRRDHADRFVNRS